MYANTATMTNVFLEVCQRNIEVNNLKPFILQQHIIIQCTFCSGNKSSLF